MMKKAQEETSNNTSAEIEKSEERTEKRMDELLKRGTGGKQLEEVKIELINKG